MTLAYIHEVRHPYLQSSKIRTLLGWIPPKHTSANKIVNMRIFKTF
jgi:hypothetical protein